MKLHSKVLKLRGEKNCQQNSRWQRNFQEQNRKLRNDTLSGTND